jgi:hypothetical protein
MGSLCGTPNRDAQDPEYQQQNDQYAVYYDEMKGQESKTADNKTPKRKVTDSRPIANAIAAAAAFNGTPPSHPSSSILDSVESDLSQPTDKGHDRIADLHHPQENTNNKRNNKESEECQKA